MAKGYSGERTAADAVITKMRFLSTPTLPTIDNPDFNLDELRLKHPQFSRWIERNVSAHQSDGCQ